MKILLDSHTLLWSLSNPGRLVPQARAEIENPDNALFFSAASVLELEIKAARNKLTLPEDWLKAARGAGFVDLPIQAEDAAASARLPWHHQDPFDRLLLAQAQIQGMTLATRDKALAVYGVSLLVV